MSPRNVAIILIVVGIVTVIVFGLADVIGLGGAPTAIGYRQIIGVIIGAIVIVVGVVLLRRSGSSPV
ncbi:MAG: hypothetical protein ACT4QB_15335 [Gammaproteobacteria bacterium]